MVMSVNHLENNYVASTKNTRNVQRIVRDGGC